MKIGRKNPVGHAINAMFHLGVYKSIACVLPYQFKINGGL
jgi:hypothetical protein